MTYEASIPIIGNPIINNLFGKQLDLRTVYNTKETLPPEMRTGKFVHLGVIDLEKIDPTDEIWLNADIREEGNTKERLDVIGNSYEVKGWLTKYIPPLFTTNFIPKDGKGRVLSAWQKYKAGLTGRFLPSYFYAQDDFSETARIIDGLESNLRHDPSFGATRESVVQGCLRLIKKNELKLDEVSIRNFLTDKLKIEKYFSDSNVTIIVNSILSRGIAGGDPLVLLQEREIWETWCQTAGFTIDNKKIFLICGDSDTYAFRAWCQRILPSITSNRDPIKIILFSKKHVPAEARKNLKTFKKNLEYFLDASFLMVQKDMQPTWPFGELELNPRKVPYEILGCVPQIIGGHDKYKKSHSFVPVEKY